MRIFGMADEDLPRFFELQRSSTSASGGHDPIEGDEAARFMRAKMKTCGSVEDQDLIFLASTRIAFVAARYALDPGPKSGCKMRRISATTKTKAEVAASASASAAPTPAAAASAAPAAPSPSGCGCTLRSPAPSPLAPLSAPALLWWRRRRTRARRLE